MIEREPEETRRESKRAWKLRHSMIRRQEEGNVIVYINPRETKEARSGTRSKRVEGPRSEAGTQAKEEKRAERERTVKRRIRRFLWALRRDIFDHTPFPPTIFLFLFFQYPLFPPRSYFPVELG